TSLEMTGIATDLAVEGNGFFVVNDGNRNFYTRAGLFDVDPTGHLVMRTNGYRVQGWQAVNGVIDPSREPEDIIIPLDLTSPARATENMFLGGNLNAETPTGGTVTVLGTVRDSLGRAHEVTFVFTKRTAPNEWTWVAQTSTGTIPGTERLVFGPNGALESGSPGTISWSPGGGAAPLNITVDFSMLTQYALPNSAEVTGHDGRVAGSLETFTIDSAGIVRGVFTNGAIEEAAQIAVAVVHDPGGLDRKSV